VENGTSTDFFQASAYRGSDCPGRKRNITFLRAERPFDREVLLHIDQVFKMTRELAFESWNVTQEVHSLCEESRIGIFTFNAYACRIIDWQFELFKKLVADNVVFGGSSFAKGEIFRIADPRKQEARVDEILWTAIASLQGAELAGRVFAELRIAI
jgi:hypothetical protein